MSGFICVGEDPTTTGVWNCDECRQTSSILHTLAQDVVSIKQYIGGIIRTVDIIPDEINGLNKRIDDLTDEVKSLQSTNTQLVSELNEQHKIISDLKQTPNLNPNLHETPKIQKIYHLHPFQSDHC